MKKLIEDKSAGSRVKQRVRAEAESDTPEKSASSKLALKWRPRLLEELVGQKTIVDEIRGMLAKQVIPNAILLSGISGVGKTTIARIIALYLNCVKGTACGKCEVCKPVFAGAEPPDYKEVDATTQGNKEDIEGLIQIARLRPRHRWRIMYIDEAHRLSIAAVNALLKPMEEPPEQTIWILASSEPDKIPNNTAVMGRCAQMRLQAISPDLMAPRLQEIAKAERFRWMSEDAALEIGRVAQGHMRNAIQITEQIDRKLAGMGKVPKDRKLVRLISELAGESQSSDLDRVVAELLIALYAGKPAAVQRAILDADDMGGLAHKLVFFNWFIVNSALVGQHKKVWGSAGANLAGKGIRSANKGKLPGGRAVTVHRELTKMLGEIKLYNGVGPEHIITAYLTDLAYEFE